MESETPYSSLHPNPAWYAWFEKRQVTKIPNATQLRKELGYGHAHERRDIKFWNDVRSFPLKFTSAGGIHGQDLIRWKRHAHQDGLLEMMDKFLELEGRGQYYWPDDPGHENFGKLQYSRGIIRIKRLLIQLFFKLNQQAKWKGSHKGHARRTAPKSKEGQNPTSAAHISPSGADREPGSNSSLDSRQRSSGSAMAQRGQDRGNPITLDEQDLEDFALGLGLDISATDAANKSTLEQPAQYTNSSFRLAAEDSPERNTDSLGLPQETNPGREQNPVAPVAPMEDPYEVPATPRVTTPRTTQRETNPGKRAAPSNDNEKDLYAKKRRSGPPQPAVSEEAGTGSAGNVTGDAASDHVRRQRNRPSAPGLVTGAEYDDALDEAQRQSPVSGSESGSDDEMDTPQSLHETTELDSPPPRTQEMPQHGATTVKDGVQSQQETRQRAPRALPQVNMIYSVTSGLRNKKWTPKGGFQNKSLPQLVEELPVPYAFKVVIFSLEIPNGAIYEEVLNIEDDEGFEAMKTRFLQKIRTCREDNAWSNKELKFEIAIAPIRHNEDGHQSTRQEDDINL